MAAGVKPEAEIEEGVWRVGEGRDRGCYARRSHAIVTGVGDGPSRNKVSLVRREISQDLKN